MAITLSSTGYCEASDVGALVQQFVIDANSDPSTTEVEGWITEDFHEINALLRGAGYVAPVAQAGGSLSAGGGSIVTAEAAVVGATSIKLQGSGGTLVGAAVRGDYMLIGSDAQRYMVTEDVNAADGEVSVYIAPPLELAATSGAAITYTQNPGASQILAKLNAYMTAVRVVQAAYSASAEAAADVAAPMVAERDRMIDAVIEGRYDMPSAAVERKGSMGTVKLVRT